MIYVKDKKLTQVILNKVEAAGTKTITSNGNYDVKNFANVMVNVEGGLSGGGDIEGLIDGSISGELTSYVSKVKNYAFAYCDNLTRLNLPNATDIGYGAFNDCDGLEEILVPKVETIQMYAFNNLNLGFNLLLPNVKTIQSYAFLGCRSRSGHMMFDFTGCKSIPTLAHTNAFDMISSYEIMVPSALYNNWVAATNWSALADHIVAY